MRCLLLCAIAIGLMAGSARANNTSGVYINEILYNPVGIDGGNQKIEIINRSALTRDLSNWSICIQFNYKRFPAGAMIPPGGLYVIHVNSSGTNTTTSMYTGPYVNINPAGDGVSLYHTFSGFSTAANMEDYLQFGTSGNPRENTANTAGLWTAGTFVPLGVEGQSVAWNGTLSLPHAIGQYCNEVPTIGAANSCGSVQFGPLTDLRINEVLVDPAGSNTGQTRVEIRNSGVNPVNAAGLYVCVDSTSYEIPGPVILPSGGFMVFHLNEDGIDTDSDVYSGTPFQDLSALDTFSLYKNGSDFLDPANMIDFFEWGDGGLYYENVAEAAGLWTSGQFFPAVFSEGMSIQWNGTGTGNSPGDFCADVPTLGTVNTCSISGSQVQPPPPILVRQNRPNPFSGTTNILLRSLKPGQRVSVTVFAVTGRAVRRLLEPMVLSGEQELVWDGRDDSGRPAPAGQYFYVVDTESGSVTRKMTLAR